MAKYEIKLKRKAGPPIRVELNEAVATFEDGTTFFDLSSCAVIHALVNMMKAEGFKRVTAEEKEAP